ncbi:hypothetical protein BT63DRAFT_158411 [Microthyrium microscopicum]|uniref:5'-deoxynucleotidase n=1 Tax=Microthyrium microscopicum TaxID=703497 RepID=A0A6A6UMJ5_9PEZI|nr:hypothetical protein BT63DRAFT_158411 [Microthyrium microscopicum]
MAESANNPAPPTDGNFDHQITASLTHLSLGKAKSKFVRTSSIPVLPNGVWTPETVLKTLDERPKENTSSPIPFFHLLERLKTNKREGWRRFEILTGESISDHMYRMAIITMVAPASLTSTLDMNKCTRMALVHDMAELLVGDITPADGVEKDEKHRRERLSMDFLTKKMLGGVDAGVRGEELSKLWWEYEKAETKESVFVHDVDKLELLLQMMEYERSHPEKDLSEFLYVATKVQTPELREWCKELAEEHRLAWEKKGRKSWQVLTPDLELVKDLKLKATLEYYKKEEE